MHNVPSFQTSVLDIAQNLDLMWSQKGIGHSFCSNAFRVDVGRIAMANQNEIERGFDLDQGWATSAHDSFAAFRKLDCVNASSLAGVKKELLKRIAFALGAQTTTNFVE